MVTVSNIINASQGELLCITYELLLENIKSATQHINEPEYKKYIQKAVEIIQMLVSDLNFNYALAKDLFRIYVYVQGLLVTAKQKEKLEEAYRLIDKLYGAFKQVAAQEDVKKPVKHQGEAIVAGMTYGKGQLNETVTHQNKGFQV